MIVGARSEDEVGGTEDNKAMKVCDEDMESDGKVEHQEIMIR